MRSDTSRAVCGAKTRSGGKCKSAPVSGRTRCRMHGGMTPVGAATHNFKHGRHSKWMPERLLERYHEGVSDPELLNMRADIALTDARLADVLERVDSGESGEAWKQARESYSLLRSGMREDKKDDVTVALIQLDTIINKGLTDYLAWHEVGTLLEQRRRLVESEQRRLVAMQQMITSEQAMTLITALTETVKRHVTDKLTLAAISADLARIVAIKSQPAA